MFKSSTRLKHGLTGFSHLCQKRSYWPESSWIWTHIANKKPKSLQKHSNKTSELILSCLFPSALPKYKATSSGIWQHLQNGQCNSLCLHYYSAVSMGRHCRLITPQRVWRGGGSGTLWVKLWVFWCFARETGQKRQQIDGEVCNIFFTQHHVFMCLWGVGTPKFSGGYPMGEPSTQVNKIIPGCSVLQFSFKWTGPLLCSIHPNCKKESWL